MEATQFFAMLSMPQMGMPPYVPQVKDALFNATTAANYTDSAMNGTIPGSGSAIESIMAGLPGIIKQFEPLMYNPYILSSMNWFFFGYIVETIRRLWFWFFDRMTAGFILTAKFDSGDPAYDWFQEYLNQIGVWNGTREFYVHAKNSSRTWGVNSGGAADGDEAHAEYAPVCDQSQIFRFKGTWCQVTRSKSDAGYDGGHMDGARLILTLYTRHRKVLDDLVETAYFAHQSRYKNTDIKPPLTIHGTCSCGGWCATSSKARRPIDSLILPEGVKEMLIGDTRDFLRSKPWYSEAGIQHKRGYLLYGSPGTGKSSTVHALASELDLEIYSMSLATVGVDDAGLSRLIANTPANSLILLEDIDCAFQSREELERKRKEKEAGIAVAEVKSSITLSGLLNVLDGVSSEEGRLLFATTNYVNRLDPALLRPGRMDVKIHYKLSTRHQIMNLFKRFYRIRVPLPPELVKAKQKAQESVEVSGKAVEGKAKETETEAEKEKPEATTDLNTPPPTPSLSPEPKEDESEGEVELDIDNPICPPVLPEDEIHRLANEFADAIPQNKYSMAELQGFLLTVRTKPYAAVEGVKAWTVEMEEEKERIAAKEKSEKEEKEKKDEEKKTEEPKPDAVPTADVFPPPVPVTPTPLPTVTGIPSTKTLKERSIMTE